MKKLSKVYDFTITLNGRQTKEDKLSPLYRNISILSTSTLSTLAKTIVKSIGFHYDHCYGFYDNFLDVYGSKKMFELFTDIPDVDHTPGAFGVEHTQVEKAYKKVGDTMLFLFDYGDNWRFIVTLMTISKPVKSQKYPKITHKMGENPIQYPEIDEDWIN